MLYFTPSERRVMFWIGCIGSRVALAWLAKSTTSLFVLKSMAYAGIVLAAAFMYLFWSGKRTTGVEVGGGRIWWNWLRPVHSILWGTFSWMVLGGTEQTRRRAWLALAADVLIGTGAYLLQYYA